MDAPTQEPSEPDAIAIDNRLWPPVKELDSSEHDHPQRRDSEESDEDRHRAVSVSAGRSQQDDSAQATKGCDSNESSESHSDRSNGHDLTHLASLAPLPASQ